MALQIGVFFFCGVDMPDAGAGGTPPQDRRYGQADFLKVYADLEAYVRAADGLGYESLWLVERTSHGRGAGPRKARPGHDEFWRFLGPYGWSKAYADELNQGKPWAYGRIPGMLREQAIDQLERFSSQIKPRLLASAETAGVSA